MLMKCDWINETFNSNLTLTRLREIKRVNNNYNSIIRLVAWTGFVALGQTQNQGLSQIFFQWIFNLFPGPRTKNIARYWNNSRTYGFLSSVFQFHECPDSILRFNKKKTKKVKVLKHSVSQSKWMIPAPFRKQCHILKSWINLEYIFSPSKCSIFWRWFTKPCEEKNVWQNSKTSQ